MNRYINPYISFIIELELYSFKRLTANEKTSIDNLLTQCTIIDINSGIKLSTINIRKKNNVLLLEHQSIWEFLSLAQTKDLTK